MAIRKIRIYPDPILRRKCRPVRRIDDDVRRLGSDMLETLIEAEGVGLAANQVGALKRIIALHLPEEEPYWLLNPEIIRAEGQRTITEGCLSLPGYEGLVTRSAQVTARALDQSGGKWRVTAQELLAQALEHEIDHLNGIMYIDHLLEHERLHRIGEDQDHSEPHMHDVNYHLQVHNDESTLGSPISSAIESGAELLVAKAKLSEVTSQHSRSELSYELREPDSSPPPKSEMDE